MVMAIDDNPCTLPECSLECQQDQIVVSFDIEYLKSEFGTSDYSLIHMGSWHYDKDRFYSNINKMISSWRLQAGVQGLSYKVKKIPSCEFILSHILKSSILFAKISMVSYSL